MNICDSNRAVSKEVLNFMQNVRDIKEESITDFLVWKWRELDKRFNYLSITTFNHAEENTSTGADFDLELWLVNRSYHVALAVQAKKFIKLHDRYVNRLNFPNGTKRQLDTLLSYAAQNNKLPFYFIYSAPGLQTKTICGLQCHGESGVFMADANTMKEFADGEHGKSISRDDLLSKSDPFHCMFCSRLFPIDRYLHQFFSESALSAAHQPNTSLPKYVQDLLSREGEQPTSDDQKQVISREGWRRFRAVGVYDLRRDA
jgi:hypothetical protein